jgi:oligoendopeptidase F
VKGRSGKREDGDGGETEHGDISIESSNVGRVVATTARELTGAESVEWDLSDLYDDEALLRSDLAEAVDAAARFGERYRGRVAELSAEDLSEALAERERIESVVDRARAYADLRFAADTSDESRGALVQLTLEQAKDVDQELLFFDLEWLALEDEQAEPLVDGADERYRGFLQATRRYRPHVLSEPEERLDTLKDLTGRSAWTRLFDQLTAELRVRLDDGEISVGEALARLMTETSRENRRRVAGATTEALQPGIRTRAYILNTIAAERAGEDRMRRYPTWISARNLANQLSDDAAQHLVDAIVARYDIAHRAFALKAKLLGLPHLADYDRYAPVATAPPATVRWEDAREVVLEAFSSFSPRAGTIVSGMFDDRRIDAVVRDGKTVGAFCRSVAERRPYVLESYTGDVRSVLVLAHELGHALHGVLANDRGVLSMRSPLTLAETASVFAEALTFRTMYEREDDPAVRLELLSRRIDDSLGTVFRQASYNRFEHAVHTTRREEGELSVDRIGGLWGETQSDANGDAVELSDGFRSWWSFIPHFIVAPGYVYAYAFGYLFSMAVYQRYLREGDAVVEPLFELLAAGGSRPPAELARGIGFDLDDPDFWSEGLVAIEALVDEAEALSAQVELPVSG